MINLKSKLPIKIFLLTLGVGAFVSLIPAIAQDLTGKVESSETTENAMEGIRILIETSGTAQFNSYWLEEPPRLVVEFQTRNIVSHIDEEVMVDQGVIKRITSEYWEEGQEEEQKRTLKSLTFELTQKVPYKIWQELNTIILDIHVPSEMSLFPEDGREVFTKNGTEEVVMGRLEAMEAALTKVSVNSPILEAPLVISEGPQAQVPKTVRKGKRGMAFWFIGLPLTFGLGFLVLLYRHKNPHFNNIILVRLTSFLQRTLKAIGRLFAKLKGLILDRNIVAQAIARLNSQLEEKNKFIQQQEIIYKIIEDTSLGRQKEFEELKLELQKEAQLLDQEERARKAIEEELSQREKEYEQLKNSYESLKEVLMNEGLVKELSSPEEKGRLGISGKSSERRHSLRLDLSRDYNRTIILRIESPDKSKNIKSFANDIGSGGLCFETRKDLEKKELVNLRLFFFGDHVPSIKVKAEIIWKKTVLPMNCYGVSFVLLEEKDQIVLNRYIESKIAVPSG